MKKVLPYKNLTPQYCRGRRKDDAMKTNARTTTKKIMKLIYILHMRRGVGAHFFNKLSLIHNVAISFSANMH